MVDITNKTELKIKIISFEQEFKYSCHNRKSTKFKRLLAFKVSQSRL